MDDTESKERHTCCVPMVEYEVGEGNFDTIFLHFDQYAKLWQKIGRNLTIDLSEHPSMEKWLMAMTNYFCSLTFSVNDHHRINWS
jgi:hypothetical protein